jgi:hypothetical protein
MIRLQFKALQDTHSITLGPAVGFRAAGNFLRQLPENVVVGAYFSHQWHVRDGHFSRYDCIDPCEVYFMDAEGTPSQVFGPFKELHVADGTMYAGDKLFAKFVDETLNFHSFELENFWPNVIIASPD